MDLEKGIRLAEKLAANRKLEEAEYQELIENRSSASTLLLREEALRLRQRIYENEVFIRGLIEISNYCKNDCLYCGIRRSNHTCDRYRLTEKEIVSCADQGYPLGFRTFVLQGGEDPYFTDDRLESIIRQIKLLHPDCAVTLSMGERSSESYLRLYQAGAERYLLRHETANEAHYRKLHPPEMSFSNRLRCLAELKRIGYQTGCGMMVGSPGQTSGCLAQDLKLIERFQPEMCGIGPFIPHPATPFGKEPPGTAELTCFLLSVIRIISPTVLLPATTALSTLKPDGREMGILSGANVVMPNLSPVTVRGKYELYQGKVSSGAESAQHVRELEARMRKIGYKLSVNRGDARKNGKE